jgi:dienelactone hydrolase
VRSIAIETYRVGEIPIMTLVEEGAERRAVVFFVHGFTGDKRAGLPLGYRLAELGFYVVCPDAHMHGERLDARIRTAWEPKADDVYPAGSGLDAFFLMHEIIVQTAVDFEKLIAYLSVDRRADTGRIGMAGLSMGGFATFYVAANNPQIQVAVPMLGIPAFAARWEDVVLEAAAYKKWIEAMEAAQEETVKRTAFIKAIDPFDKLRSFHPRPLLMLVGDQDLDSPKKYSVDLYRELRPLYAEHPERLRLSIHDDAAHRVTPLMMEEACDWFRRYLPA